MRIPLIVPCVDCGERLEVSMSLQDHEISYKCSRGHENAGPVEGTIGDFVQRRAEHELKVTKDYAVSMVFSATAFECELSRLHHKWEHINALERAEDVTDEDLDARLRRYPNIRDKIDAADVIAQGYPSLQGGSLAEGFQKALFWPRGSACTRSIAWTS